MGRDDVEELLARIRQGDPGAEDALARVLHPQLRALARKARAGGGRHAGPGTDSLVHEAYLKLLRSRSDDWESRQHFLTVAAKAMRQVLVDAARARLADKRGGGDADLALPDSGPPSPSRAEEIIVVDQALSRLGQLNPRLRQVVELRFFAELSVDETARVLGVTARTVNRDWLKARMFIWRDLYGES